MVNFVIEPDLPSLFGATNPSFNEQAAKMQTVAIMAKYNIFFILKIY